jgi:hypothetical protein
MIGARKGGRVMPHHWRPIAPDNPGPKERADAVAKAVQKHGGKLKFCGREEGAQLWWALVDVHGVADPEAMWRDIQSLAPGKTLLAPEE